MLHREIIAVCSQIHIEHINTLCGRNVELLKVKPRGTYSDHWTHRANYCDANSYKTSTETAEGTACVTFCSNPIGD
jgi:hypothetical protein